MFNVKQRKRAASLALAVVTIAANFAMVARSAEAAEPANQYFECSLYPPGAFGATITKDSGIDEDGNCVGKISSSADVVFQTEIYGFDTTVMGGKGVMGVLSEPFTITRLDNNFHCYTGGASVFVINPNDGTFALCAAVCGDGLVDYGEQCDDGGTETGDGCDDTCQIEIGGGSGAVCGNNEIEPGEGCDDGNTYGGDGCDAFCQIEEEITGGVTMISQEQAEQAALDIVETAKDLWPIIAASFAIAVALSLIFVSRDAIVETISKPFGKHW